MPWKEEKELTLVVKNKIQPNPNFEVGDAIASAQQRINNTATADEDTEAKVHNRIINNFHKRHLSVTNEG